MADNAQKVITQICKETGQEFTILPVELEFYEKNNLPLPEVAPEIRQARRLELSRTRQLHVRNCDKCGKEMLAVYPAKTDFTVYCQNCYWESV